MVKRRGLAQATLGLSLLLLVWLAAGAGQPWCLDNGLRLLAASGPDVLQVTDLGLVVNASSSALVLPDALTRSTHPVVAPFVHWEGGRAHLVFPPLYLSLLWAFSRLGKTGPVLLALCTGLLLSWAARRFAQSQGAEDDDPLWLPALLASPVLFYLGTTWEVGLVCALVLLLLQERKRPLPPMLSTLYGFLPWLRPEALIFWAGGFLLLQGWRRRAWSAVSFLVGIVLHRQVTGSWLWLQVEENFADSVWRPLHTVATLGLPVAEGAWIWLALPLLALLVLLARTGSWLIWLAYGLSLTSFFLAQAESGQDLRPCWGVLATAPLAAALLVDLCTRRWRLLREPEWLILAIFLVVVGIASPVAAGFHWGPRLWVPALVPLTLLWAQRMPAGPTRRAGLGVGVLVQALGLLVLAQRHSEWRSQSQVLTELQAPALLVGESWLLGDHPALAHERLVYLPWGTGPARALLPALQGRNISTVDVVARPGHPLSRYLQDSLSFQLVDAPIRLQGGALTKPLEWRRYRLPAR